MEKLELYKDLPGYESLSDEQKAIVARWDQERITRDKYINMLTEATQTKDEELWKRALDGLTSDDSNAFMCEHERHWSADCSDCQAIERILRPELFCSECEYPLDYDDIDKGILTCGYCKDKDNEQED